MRERSRVPLTHNLWNSILLLEIRCSAQSSDLQPLEISPSPSACPLAHLVPQVGARRMPVQILVDVRDIAEVSLHQVLSRVDGDGDLLTVPSQQHPASHVHDLPEIKEKDASQDITSVNFIKLLYIKWDQRSVTTCHYYMLTTWH